ncbi:protein DDI1 homolog 2-like [Gigantopelta aegis]|uniref:protein DDI1 homolog 2-like n=1 Tax=Gigantopelta aegis TaxID=1735272 RepID=UPI001B88DADB|nr:protein DDI1 homolog 2-like [Gigantopelta aegis]
MQITVTTLSDQIFTLDVGEDMELENFKALCEFESGVPATEIAILWNGRPLTDNKQTLKQYGVKGGDVLLLQHMRGSSSQLAGNPAIQQSTSRTPASSSSGIPVIDFGSIQIPGRGTPSRSSSAVNQGVTPAMMEDPAFVRQMLLSNPHQLSLLKERNPPLADALASGSVEIFNKVFKAQQEERFQRDRERIRLATADPFDAEAQKKIAEEIRLKNVESNMETAMEFAPESFGQVVMLYVDCRVNGHAVKAFVDSGAQMTIMSQACAERCNIMRLVDKRWAGIAKGVGTQKIIGRVHLCQIQIGPDFLQSSFSILEDQPMDMLLGLDMLKRHQCCLDLKRNVLVIGTTSTVTKFLSEGDLPEHARLNLHASSTSEDDQDLAQALSQSAAEAAKQTGEGTSSDTHGASGSRSGILAFSESVVSALMANGFSRQAVLEELRIARGNSDQALAALFAKSFHMP